MSGTDYNDEADVTRALRQLGEQLQTPATDEAVTRIREAVIETSPSHARPGRKLVAVAAALVAVAVASIAPVRSAIADLLGIDGIRIREMPEVETPPAVGAGFELGQRVDLETARGRVDFDLLVPSIDWFGTEPDVYVRDVGGGIVSFVFGRADGDRPPAIVTEFKADPVDAFEKILQSGTRVERLTVNGEDALWIHGDEHLLFFVDPKDGFIEVPGHLAGNTLLWTRGDVTLRLEGALTLDEALAVAEATHA